MARKTFPGGIRAQLLVPVLILLVATLALIGAAILQLTKRQLREMIEVRALSQAHVLSSEISRLPPDQRTDLMARQLGSTGVNGMAWRGEQGMTLVHAENAALEEMLSREITAKPDKHTAKLHRVEDRLYMVAEYSQGGDARDRAMVAIDMSSLQGQLDGMRDLILIYALVNVIFLAILSYALFTYLVIRPLRVIGVATERAAQGDLASPIKLLPRNEFGHLSRQFNAMLEQLEHQRGELQLKVEALEAANLAIHHAQNSLIRSEKLASVGQLAAGVAHEVGNPLAVILGYAELLDDDDLDEDFRQEIAPKIIRQVERMRVIIRELLDFSRDDSQQAISPVDLIACVEEAISLASTTKRTRGIRITNDLPESLPRVGAIHSQIVQVLINLILNAADALTSVERDRIDRGEITLMGWHDAQRDQAILRVADNGPGIPKEIISKLFDPFFTTKPPGEGTGLGLAICARIMENFGGELLLLEDHPDHPEGACFELRLATHQPTAIIDRTADTHDQEEE